VRWRRLASPHQFQSLAEERLKLIRSARRARFADCGFGGGPCATEIQQSGKNVFVER
jgi:hypothetical protein